MEKKILIVDDEQGTREFLRFLLESRGFGVLLAQSATEALELARTKPALVMLDVMMPNVDGWEIAKLLKEHPETAMLPIMFITASQQTADEVKGFEIGATDFVTKPFNIPTLMARITSILHRYDERANVPKIIQVNDITLDVENYSFAVDGTTTQLPKREFEVLLYLARNQDKLVTREEMLLNVWGTESFVTERTIDVHIRQIRKKLGNHAASIQTVKGMGYRFATTTSDPSHLKLISLQ